MEYIVYIRHTHDCQAMRDASKAPKQFRKLELPLDDDANSTNKPIGLAICQVSLLHLAVVALHYRLPLFSRGHLGLADRKALIQFRRVSLLGLHIYF